ncbi:MAG: phosphatase PAP2 family protein [Spirochaetales bacterium]|nr:phosphatase PAP2 family protein [Spirochaetales bacterium]
MKRSSLGRLFYTTAVLFLILFAIFTYLVMTYDVTDSGFEGTRLGFSAINLRFHRAFGYSEKSFTVTEYLGYICVAAAAANALIAFLDLIRAKWRISHMHRRYVITMVFYAVVVAIYVLFLFVKINYRPNEMEASYPSSHTMLGICVMASEIAILHYSARRLHFWVIIFQIISFVAMVCMVVFRLLSGVHWLTDIIGSGLLSCSLVSAYLGTLVLYGRHAHHHHR